MHVHRYSGHACLTIEMSCHAIAIKLAVFPIVFARTLALQKKPEAEVAQNLGFRSRKGRLLRLPFGFPLLSPTSSIPVRCPSLVLSSAGVWWWLLCDAISSFSSFNVQTDLRWLLYDFASPSIQHRRRLLVRLLMRFSSSFTSGVFYCSRTILEKDGGRTQGEMNGVLRRRRRRSTSVQSKAT